MIPRVLSIAGTDPTGGAGLHADLKSIAAHGGYGMGAVTALVAQNTRGVRAVHTPDPTFLTTQLDAVSDDVDIDAVKIGMLGNSAVIDAVHAWLMRVRPPRVVLDPVMIATSGDRLLNAEAEDALRALLPLADVVTPNAPELAVLVSDETAADEPALVAQARRLAAEAGVLVLAKGGHLAGPTVTDALVGSDGAIARFRSPRIETTSTHGTGCSLSAALATLAARDGDWALAAGRAHRWLAAAIANGERLRVGQGHGPVHHGHEHERALPGAGPVTSDWWHGISELNAEIGGLPFLRSLADGSLDRDTFRWYLAQDAVYLDAYADLLARAAELAPDPAAHAFWRTGSAGAVAEAERLHLRWTTRADEPSAVTRAYLDHLSASAEAGYETLIAALLPCYWIYQDVGERLRGASRPGHPYREWLDSYGDDAFAAATRRAKATVEQAAAHAPPETLARMRGAFLESARHEREFFAEPLRRR